MRTTDPQNPLATQPIGRSISNPLCKRAREAGGQVRLHFAEYTSLKEKQEPRQP